jgi:26S proteasome regulatory subunit T3
MELDSVDPDNNEEEEDLYQQVLALEQSLEFIDLQEEYLKDELRYLSRELLRAKEEIRRIQSVPLVIGQFNEMVDANYGIVGSTAGSNYYVRILSTLDRELLKPNASIALHRHSHSVVDILPPESDSTVKLVESKPTVTYKDIGGMDVQKQEVREAIELPLIQHHLYQQIGIDPPRGVLLYVYVLLVVIAFVMIEPLYHIDWVALLCFFLTNIVRLLSFASFSSQRNSLYASHTVPRVRAKP